MERQIPKNVRQIGNVSDTPKIYVEDYVDTFFTQLCEKAGETPPLHFLSETCKRQRKKNMSIYMGQFRCMILKQMNPGL